MFNIIISEPKYNLGMISTSLHFYWKIDTFKKGIDNVSICV